MGDEIGLNFFVGGVCNVLEIDLEKVIIIEIVYLKCSELWVMSLKSLEV